MSSTNKTTHYDLSQYVSSDKPTYLSDYNGDMLKIDTAINAAKTTADTASTAATNAGTAAEGAQNTANTAITNAATADGKATTANTNIGTLANLTTTVKTDLVNAINEVDGNVDSLTSRVGTLETEAGYLDGTVLFTTNQTNGEDGDVTLSESISNYDEVEIVYGGAEGDDMIVQRIYTSTNSFSLYRFIVNSSNLMAYTTNYTLTDSKTKIHVADFLRGTIGGQVHDYNFNRIYKVIGYKRF